MKSLQLLWNWKSITYRWIPWTLKSQRICSDLTWKELQQDSIRSNSAGDMPITFMSHECHGISDDQHYDHLFHSLFRLMSKKIWNLCHWPIVSGIHQWFPHKRPLMQQSFSMSWCHHEMVMHTIISLNALISLISPIAMKLLHSSIITKLI